MLRTARSAREHAARRRQLAMLHATYPTVARALGVPRDWSVHRIISTVGDVAVALIGGASPSAVLKCAGTPRGSAALERSGAVVAALAAEPALDGWTGLLPRRMAGAHGPDGQLAVLEELLPGVDGRALISPAAAQVATDAVHECVATLHRVTARTTVVDERLLSRLVDEPTTVLRKSVGAYGGPRGAALDRLREDLRRSMSGRRVDVGWVHGDLAPGNVLFDPSTRRVSGLLDWERGSAAGIPELDLVHWQLTLQMLTQGRELGDIVCSRLDWPGAPDDAGVTDSLLLLAWLHHVSGNLAKSQRFGARGIWAMRNVYPVLTRVYERAGGITR